MQINTNMTRDPSYTTLWDHPPNLAKNVLLLHGKQWSHQVKILHMPWQLSCHGMCKLFIWLDHYLLHNNKMYLKNILIMMFINHGWNDPQTVCHLALKRIGFIHQGPWSFDIVDELVLANNRHDEKYSLHAQYVPNVHGVLLCFAFLSNLISQHLEAVRYRLELSDCSEFAMSQ